MRLWYAGGEISPFRRLLHEMGVTDVALSYVGLTRKLKHPERWSIAEHFEGQHVLLDSGGYSLNHSTAPYPAGDVATMVANYELFVQTNLAALDYVLELDAVALGPDGQRQHRDALREIAGEKAVMVWHPHTGVAELLLLAERWPNIAIADVDLDGRDLTPTLVGLARQGTRLFGLAMTKPGVMAAIPWYSVSSTSWLSPGQYGDTIIWSRGELHRYHKRQKEQARRRHRTEIEAAGLDAELVLADDRTEVLKLSVWSWQQQLAALNRVTQPPQSPEPPNAENSSSDVAQPPPPARNEPATPAPRASIPLPGLNVELVEHVHVDPDSGAREVRELPVVRSDGTTHRRCDTCYIKDVCAWFEPGADCVFEVSVELATEEQIDALLRLLLEHEARDYLLEDYEGQLLGGGDRTRAARSRASVARLVKMRQELRETGFVIKVSGRGPAASTPGFISRIFAPPQDGPPALEAKAPGPDAYEQAGIVDVEVVGDEIE
jgi:hypothetical protein